MDSGFDFTVREREFLAQLINETVGDGLFILQGQERMNEINFPLHDRIHVVFDVLRIGGDDRAVVVIVGIFKFIPLVRNGRIENVFYAFVDQPLHMSVGQFCRVTLGLAGDGLDTQFIYLTRGSGREDNAEAQFCEKCKPERVVLVHNSVHAEFRFRPVSLQTPEGVRNQNSDGACSQTSSA